MRTIMPTDRNDPFRAGKPPMAAGRQNQGRVRTPKSHEDNSYGQGPRMQDAMMQANQGGNDPHGGPGRFPPGAQPQLKGQAKEDNRRQENRQNQAMHSSGSGIPPHQYEPTPPAGKVP
jgi:hypothetical protein